MADLSVWTDSAVGPASYTAGGFVITTGLTSVQSFEASISAAGANLGQVGFEYDLNTPVAGQVTVRPLRETYAKLTSMTDPTGLPVATATTSGQSFDTDTHTHVFAHDHAVSPASTANAGGAGGVVALPASPAASTHTHTVDLVNFIPTTGTSAPHTHTLSIIYQHQHSVTNTTTTGHVTEIPDTTDLSGATLNYVGVGTV